MRLSDIPERPLQIVFFDHVKIEDYVVDERTGETGYPWLTLAIDANTRMIAGFHLSLAPPSRVSLSLCLLHAVCDKARWMKRARAHWRLARRRAPRNHRHRPAKHFRFSPIGARLARSGNRDGVRIDQFKRFWRARHAYVRRPVRQSRRRQGQWSRAGRQERRVICDARWRATFARWNSPSATASSMIIIIVRTRTRDARRSTAGGRPKRRRRCARRMIACAFDCPFCLTPSATSVQAASACLEKHSGRRGSLGCIEKGANAWRSNSIRGIFRGFSFRRPARGPWKRQMSRRRMAAPRTKPAVGIASCSSLRSGFVTPIAEAPKAPPKLDAAAPARSGSAGHWRDTPHGSATTRDFRRSIGRNVFNTPACL